jgi:tetratricopeptide (TPR) repeat protein
MFNLIGHCFPSAVRGRWAMQPRDAALAALLGWLARVTAALDPSEVLTAEGLSCAARLAPLIDPDEDLEAAAALGKFHWFRYMALPEGADQDDFHAAERYFAPIFQRDLQAGPAPLRSRVSEPTDSNMIGEGVDSGYLTREAIGLFTAYERTNKLSLLTQAVALFRGAVSALPRDHPDAAGHLNNLCSALRTLSARTENGRHAPVLMEAVQAGRDAVAATPRGHPDRAMYLNNLGNALQTLAERTGDQSILEEAVQIGRDSLVATPDDHADRAAHLSNLGNGLRTLYERTGDTAHLTEAIDYGLDAVAVTPRGHVDRPRYLNNLGIAQHLMYERTSEKKFLKDAVRTGRSAVEGTPPGYGGRATYLNSLKGSLEALHEHTGDIAYLQEAIQAGRLAIEVTPPADPSLPIYLHNYGIAMLALARRNGDSSALTEAIRAGRAAVAATSADHPDRAGRLNGLGGSLLVLYERTGETSALAEAGRCLDEAAGMTSAPARMRIAAYQTLAGLPGQAGVSPENALAAIEAAVGLLPQLVPHRLVRADREHSVGQLASLPGLAAAVAVAAGRPDRAVELLELTRGILVANTLYARSSDLSRLRASEYPELADQFERLRGRVEAFEHLGALSAPPAGIDDGSVGRAKDRRDAFEEWDRLLERIRAVKDFGDFFLPPGIEQLALQAKGGSVVFVYTSPARSGALILTDNPGAAVLSVPLTQLTGEDARRQANRLLAAQLAAADPRVDASAHGAAQDVILDVLGWIWDTITGPVLTGLGHVSAPAEGQPWPRVWWCPVGNLSYLPLHASGHHDPVEKGQQRTSALDRVVSSYITTVRGLAYAREQHMSDNGQTLIVAVPDAVGVPSLPWAAAEADELAAIIPGAYVLPTPTRDATLAALSNYPVAHFACHGYANWANPAASQLMLYDHLTAPLTVANITKQRLSGGMAFLSACHTAVTNPALVNESVHITGAFHVAGYQQVIGTLWPVYDDAARNLAVSVYRQLTHGGTCPPDTSMAALALHKATRDSRDDNPEIPTSWAAYVHTGI